MYEHRADLSNAEPRLGHFGRFEEKLNASKQVSKKRRISYKWFAGLGTAACIVALLAFGLGRVSNSEPEFEVLLPSNNHTEFASFERASATKINDQLGDVRLMYNKHNSSYISEAMALYKSLENEYYDLKQGYKVTGNNKIAEAMAQNISARECFLDQLLLNLEHKQTNNLYNASYESNASHMVATSESCGFFKANGLSALPGENIPGELRSQR